MLSEWDFNHQALDASVTSKCCSVGMERKTQQGIASKRLISQFTLG